MQKSFVAVVPAAGLGSRMKSDTPKFLHKVCGQSIIVHIMRLLRNSVDEIVVVVGNGKEQVIAEIETQCADYLEMIKFVEQKELLGSGHAVKMAMPSISEDVKNVIVVLGDMPLLSTEVVNEMTDFFQKKNAKVLVSTAQLKDPFGYGRIIRDANGDIETIVEEKDCAPEQRSVTEANMYPFCFTKEFLEKYLDELVPNNAQGEQYLTDLVAIARSQNEKIVSYLYTQTEIAQGVNDRSQLSVLEKFMKEQINQTHMKNGVTMIDPDSTYIGIDVTIDQDVTILPGTILEGKTSIAKGSTIGPNTRIVDSVIGQNCTIESSTVKESTIEDDVTVGPYASLRPGTLLREGVHVGTFVEMKKSQIGKGSKVPHLSYLGDATVGENSNLGAGTITANYDGKDKHQTIIGDDVKLGVNTVLVAPVEIGDEVYSAAGAVITKDVPKESLAKGIPAEIVSEWTPPAKRK